jgi:hypothetical protein
MPFLPESQENAESAPLQEYALAKSPPIGELLQETFAPGERLSVNDLPRIKVPAGGGQVWEMPHSGEAMRSFEGVIIQREVGRVYWKDAYGTGDSASPSPPDCQSDDGVTGEGIPGGHCDLCPLDKYGTAHPYPDGSPGRGKACKQINRLFILLPDGILPSVLITPPTAHSDVRNYCVVSRANLGETYFSISTKFGLRRVGGYGGIEYSVPTFSPGSPLDPELLAKVKEYRASFLPHLTRSSISEGMSRSD